MVNRRRVRELALQVLFVWDAQDKADLVLANQVVMDYSPETEPRQPAIDMATGTWEWREVIDKQVDRIAPQWPSHRQGGVDRNLIRLAAWEMTHTKTPPKVILDEAIEMARHFSTENSPAFVNGVLDAILREHMALLGLPMPEKTSVGEVALPPPEPIPDHAPPKPD